MKKLITAIAIIISLQTMGQSDSDFVFKYNSLAINLRDTNLSYTGILQPIGLGSTVRITPPKDEILISKFDTTVLFAGDKKCKHKFVSKEYSFSFSSCGVYHDLAGCPEHWLKEKQICTTCLRHIDIKETRRVEVVKNEYESALERLNKKLNK